MKRTCCAKMTSRSASFSISHYALFFIWWCVLKPIQSVAAKNKPQKSRTLISIQTPGGPRGSDRCQILLGWFLHKRNVTADIENQPLSLASVSFRVANSCGMIFAISHIQSERSLLHVIIVLLQQCDIWWQRYSGDFVWMSKVTTTPIWYSTRPHFQRLTNLTTGVAEFWRLGPGL